MKRMITSVLGALAVAAGFSLFAAPAQAVTCTPITVNVPASTYPRMGLTGSFTYDCTTGGAGAGFASTLNSTLYGMNSGFAPHLYGRLANIGARFYIFDNVTDYNTYFADPAINLPHPTPPAKTYGWTVLYPSSYIPATTSFFLRSNGAPANDLEELALFDFSVYHEAGHWADYFYASLLSAPGTFSSGSNMFKDLRAKDMLNMDAVYPQATKQCSSTGSGGIFNGKMDPDHYHLPNPPGTATPYLCSLGAGGLYNTLPLQHHSGNNTSTILDIGYPASIGPQVGPSPNPLNIYPEFFANEIAVSAGKDTAGPLASGALGQYAYSQYFTGNRMSCTMYVVNKLMKLGVLPTVLQLSSVRRADNAFAVCPTGGAGWPTLAP